MYMCLSDTTAPQDSQSEQDRQPYIYKMVRYILNEHMTVCIESPLHNMS